MTEEFVRHGVPAPDAEGEDLAERVGSPSDWMVEVRERGMHYSLDRNIRLARATPRS